MRVKFYNGNNKCVQEQFCSLRLKDKMLFEQEILDIHNRVYNTVDNLQIDCKLYHIFLIQLFFMYFWFLFFFLRIFKKKIFFVFFDWCRHLMVHIHNHISVNQVNCKMNWKANEIIMTFFSFYSDQTYDPFVFTKSTD